MKIPVRLNDGFQTASVVFAGKKDFAFVGEWQVSLGSDQNPRRVDSVDFAWITAERVKTHSEIEPYAEEMKDIGDHIAANPNAEIACCVLLTCDWFPLSRVIGVAHFRRTWSNNIVLDYLASHPYISKADHKVNGSGLALLYFMSTVARHYECSLIWGEATPLSCDYYKKIFKLKSVEDLIHVPRENFLAFIDWFDKTKMVKGEAAAKASPELEEMYALEETDSAFVGTKTTVFNPRRRLANRFLDLPYHSQIAIATKLGLLQDGDKAQMANEQFRRFFERAVKNKQLSSLWREVEQLYPDGEPDKNPFPES